MFTASFEGAAPAQYFGAVVESGLEFGLALVAQRDGRMSFWGMLSPRDPIAYWRATEILAKLTEIKGHDLSAAYSTACRNPSGRDKERAEEIISRIGEKTYDEIMGNPVPEEIVRYIIDHQKDDISPSVYGITEEVRAGTLEWREEFAKIGAQHPDAVDADRQRRERVVARFEQHLNAYAEHKGLPRECFGMADVEGALVSVIDKGLEGHGEDVVMGLAALIGTLRGSDFVAHMMPSSISKDGHYADMERTKLEKAGPVADWLVKRFNPRKFLFFRSKGGRSANEYRQILIELVDNHFRAPAPQPTN